MKTKLTYNKTEKLKSKKTIDNLFANGKSFVVFPLKIFYQFTANESDETSINCGVGVSKKNFAKATDRNRIKRLLRETYRLNQFELHQTITQKKLHLFIIYINNKMPLHQQELNTPWQEVIQKICNKYNHLSNEIK